MDSFERAFCDTERAADSTLRSATEMAKLARQLQKAAKGGNIAVIKKTQDKLDAALRNLDQVVTNAVRCWPFQDEEEERYLKGGYTAELRRAASEMDLEIHERDGRLVSYPSIVRILPGERAVRIDTKKFVTIRPSHLAGILIENQKKPRRYRAEPFLRALYWVYSELVREESPDRLMKSGPGRVVTLDKIYKLFTSLPRQQSKLYTHGLRSGSVLVGHKRSDNVEDGRHCLLPRLHRYSGHPRPVYLCRAGRPGRPILRRSVYRSGLMPNKISVDGWLQIIDDEYLSTFVKNGGASIKFAVDERGFEGRLMHENEGTLPRLGLSLCSVGRKDIASPHATGLLLQIRPPSRLAALGPPHDSAASRRAGLPD